MDDEKLIELVKNNEAIYKKKCGRYRLTELRASAWHNIAQQLGAADADCIRKWTTLRDRYTKECRKLEAPSGSGASRTVEWEHFDAMCFLRPYVTPRKTRESHRAFEEMFSQNKENEGGPMLSDLEDTTYSGGDAVPQSPTSYETTQSTSKRKIVVEEEIASACKSVQDYYRGRKEDASESDLFSKLLSAKIKKLSAPLQNEAMQNMLDYCIALESYDNGFTDKKPKSVKE